MLNIFNEVLDNFEAKMDHYIAQINELRSIAAKIEDFSCKEVETKLTVKSFDSELIVRTPKRSYKMKIFFGEVTPVFFMKNHDTDSELWNLYGDHDPACESDYYEDMLTQIYWAKTVLEK